MNAKYAATDNPASDTNKHFDETIAGNNALLVLAG
jgi:hypothetical protein